MARIVSKVHRAQPDSKHVRDYAFISYARADRNRLDHVLLNPIRQRGIDIWFDEHLEFDTSWWQTVRERLKDAHAIIVVMTEAARGSQWVTREVTVAVESKKPIFPVLLEGAPIEDLADRQMLVVGEGQTVTDGWLDDLESRVTRGRRQRHLRAVGSRSLAALLVLAGLIVVWQFIATRFASEELPELSGTWNLGVANFEEPDDTGLREDLQTEIATFESKLVTGVEEAIAVNPSSGELSRIGLTMDVAVVPRTVNGQDPESRRARAADLAIETDANMLLYGRITSDGALLLVEPELYLRSLPRAEELAGRIELAPITGDISRPDTDIQLNTQILTLSRHLAQLLFAIGHYNRSEWQEALRLVRGLGQDGFSQPGLLLVFEGNLLGKLARHDEATAAYEEALDTPYEERARLGLAQALFSEGLDHADSCGPGTDASIIRQALNAYRALQGASEDDGSNIHIKGLFGEARAQACLAAANSEGDQARAHELLIEVVEAYERSSPRDMDLLELAAEAEGLLGILAGLDVTTPEQASEALQHLERAGELSIDDSRKIAFRLEKVRIHAQVADIQGACSELDQVEPLLGVERTDELRISTGCVVG